MRLGVIADVHSNIHALRSAAEVMDAERVEKILFAGDAVGYGANPNECCDTIRRICHRSIRGNHDEAVVTRIFSGMNPYAHAAVSWTVGTLSGDARIFLESLRPSASEVIENRTIAMFHGSPRTMNEYVYAESAHEDILDIAKADLVILGHTHMPYVKEFTKGIVLNPGSVGQPRDHNPQGSLAIIETDPLKCRIIRFDYPIDDAAKAIIDQGLPHVLAERLRIGW